MKFSAAAVSGIFLVFSSLAAHALYVPPSPPPVSSASAEEEPDSGGSPIYTGMRANREMIAGASSAKIHPVSDKYAGIVAVYYHDQNLKQNINTNPVLRQYLAAHDISVEDVLGAQNRRGQLIVFVKPN